MNQSRCIKSEKADGQIKQRPSSAGTKAGGNRCQHKKNRCIYQKENRFRFDQTKGYRRKRSERKQNGRSSGKKTKNGNSERIGEKKSGLRTDKTVVIVQIRIARYFRFSRKIQEQQNRNRCCGRSQNKFHRIFNSGLSASPNTAGGKSKKEYHRRRNRINVKHSLQKNGTRQNSMTLQTKNRKHRKIR